MLIKYLALWINQESAMKLNELMELHNMKLEKSPNDPLHVTLNYQPSENEAELFSLVSGKQTKITVMGIGSDGENTGVRIRFGSDVERYYKGSPIPHITLSLTEGSSAKHTAKLTFDDVEPFQLECMFGYFVSSIHGEHILF